LAISFEQFLGLPAFLGMMMGLSFLMMVAYFIRTGNPKDEKFDVMELVASAEWDTLLFFFGVIFSIGGLSLLGYMELASHTMYEGWGAGATNISLGIISAVLDNIPVMFAVLTMNPAMDNFQWMLITLTTGVGGSLLSIGSAAGVALMGTARGHYTFLGHLKWTPVLVLGYVAAIGAHFILNG
jgi:Na+/H+ antiporter NhaD/arsenite permease-like protein